MYTNAIIMRPSVITVFSHLAGWVLFFSLILAFIAGSPFGEFHFWEVLLSSQFLLFSGIYLLLFYLNYFVLIPALYIKKKYIVYFAIICLLFVAVYFIKPFDKLISIHPPPNRGGIAAAPKRLMIPPAKPPTGPGSRDINSIILFVTIWSISTAIPIIRQLRLSERRTIQAETERANAELAFLKSQVNPHFLFNTLNNIYSLAITNSEHTAPSILRLSSIMRYVTDEVGEDFVPLEKEVNCMENYVDLQKLRLGNKTKVVYSIKGQLEGKCIPPLLLMTFVENAFKYGISSHEESVISISLVAEEQTINFYTTNKLFSATSANERTGIGLANAKQRLIHLYPNRHFLAIDTEEGSFTVRLTLQA
jgi:two-component system, LytTR family, sensor kinase